MADQARNAVADARIAAMEAEIETMKKAVSKGFEDFADFKLTWVVRDSHGQTRKSGQGSVPKEIHRLLRGCVAARDWDIQKAAEILESPKSSSCETEE